MAMVRGFKGGKADVILRPSEKVALQTTDLTSIYGKEVVFKDVEFKDQQQIYGISPSSGSPGGTSTFLGDIVRGLFGK
jgi:ABC-type transporter Mla maintaining outer membrane lipid asymmetry ATPase subunit MlaF